jgi:hypothetical protein
MASRNSHPRSLGIVYLNGSPASTSYSWPRRLRVPTFWKQGDRAGINMNTVWKAPHKKHDINERLHQVLGNDLQNSARDLDNAMKYKELLCEANMRAQWRWGPSV